MKRRILVGSLVAVVLLLLIPMANAIQIQTVERKISNQVISYERFKEMNPEELVVFIESLAQVYPQIYKEFQRSVDKMKNTLVQPTSENNIIEKMGNNIQRSQPLSDNQTFLEKVYWKIFNYRLFRLYISACLFLYFQSNLALLRTTTWAIRLLRWVKIGILLGYINTNQQQPQTPTIVFEQDIGNRTLSVTSVSSADILWSDIAQIGAGGCDPFPEGNVTVGDTIIDCSGIIVLQYVPTQEVLGVFQFDQWHINAKQAYILQQH
jgi:hypothetical protein